MADFSFNISLGREVEFHTRVNDNDPANSALILLVLALSGLEVDSTLRTYTTVSALLAASNNEATNTNYGRKTLTDSDIAAPSVSNSLNQTTLSFSNQTYTNIAAGDTWAKMVMAYDSDTTGGSDANLIPVCAWDLRGADGNYLIPASTTYVIGAANGYLIAS